MSGDVARKSACATVADKIQYRCYTRRHHGNPEFVWPALDAYYIGLRNAAERRSHSGEPDFVPAAIRRFRPETGGLERVARDHRRTRGVARALALRQRGPVRPAAEHMDLFHSTGRR